MLGNDSIIFNLSNSCVKTYTKCVNTNEKSNVLPYSVNTVLGPVQRLHNFLPF